MKEFLKNFFAKRRQQFCRHEFLLEDLKQTGIPPAPKPAEDAPWKVWMEYQNSIYRHPSHTQRVEWACRKCRKVFREQCGLDVLSKHGKLVSRNP